MILVFESGLNDKTGLKCQCEGFSKLSVALGVFSLKAKVFKRKSSGLGCGELKDVFT